tara:strand:- start:707 stop:1159 length:453 start_codon:yes stop_codon:yes gene_type:complete
MENQFYKNNARKVSTNAAFGKTNSAYPGQNMGASLEQVKNLVENSEKIVGVSFTSAAGTVTPNIQLPATAKYIKGFVFTNTVNTDTFDLLINEERAIANGSSFAFTADTGKPNNKSYYEFMRPVASATAVNLNYTSVAGGRLIVLQVIYV